MFRFIRVIASGWVSVLLLAASLSLNVFLGLRVARQVSKRPSAISFLEVGKKITSLDAMTLDGRKKVLTWVQADRPTLVYVFSPACVWCRRNTESIDQLVASIRSSYQIIGISNTDSGLNDYVSARGINYPVYSTVDPRFTELGTPSTLLFSAQGVVEAEWRGAYANGTKKSIEAKFNVALPGFDLVRNSARH